VDWINPTGARKVHSLIDKVYKRKNLEMAWEMVKANRGSGGVDGQSLDASPRNWISSWIGCRAS
jgi:RNA-directed DNA polymerase